MFTNALHPLGVLALTLAVVVAGALPAAADTSATSSAPAILGKPSTEDLIYLAYGMTATVPPFDTWAQADDRVTSLDEFKQQAAAAALAEQMRARADRLKGTRLIRVELQTSFGEYNTQYGEYDFDVSDGTYISFDDSRLSSAGVQVSLANGGAASTWSLSPDAAETLLKRVHENRNVVLDMTLRLNSATLPQSSSEPIGLDATVLSYNILAAATNLRLGHVDVK